MDTTQIKLLDGSRVYIQAMEGSTTSIPKLMVDGGIKNYNASVDEIVDEGLLKRVLAQAEVEVSQEFDHGPGFREQKITACRGVASALVATIPCEGDLLAAAGVPYRVGRKPRKVFSWPRTANPPAVGCFGQFESLAYDQGGRG